MSVPAQHVRTPTSSPPVRSQIAIDMRMPETAYASMEHQTSPHASPRRPRSQPASSACAVCVLHESVNVT